MVINVFTDLINTFTKLLGKSKKIKLFLQFVFKGHFELGFCLNSLFMLPLGSY